MKNHLWNLCGAPLRCYVGDEIGKLNKTYLQGRRSLVEISSTTSTLRGHTPSHPYPIFITWSFIRDRILALLIRRVNILPHSLKTDKLEAETAAHLSLCAPLRCLWSMKFQLNFAFPEGKSCLIFQLLMFVSIQHNWVSQKMQCHDDLIKAHAGEIGNVYQVNLQQCS